MVPPFSYSIGSHSLLLFLVFCMPITGTQGECGPPPKMNHTEPITGDSFPIGHTVVYSCDRTSGYYEIPENSKTITCLDDSTWSQISELCIRACEPPPRLQYGELQQIYVLMNIFRSGLKVSYKCRPGYTRVPGTSSSVTCMDDFTWSTPAEFCKLRSCGNPGDIDNGELEATDFLFGSRVTYRCNEGYRMISRRNYRDCEADGSWSNIAPQCEAQICTPPEQLINGSFNPYKDEYRYQEAVTFSCNKGLTLFGESSIFCSANGTWSSPTPTCKVVSCQDPLVPSSIRLSGFVGPYTLNSAVRFECVENLLMNGSDSVVCNIHSQWEPPLPECLNGCSSPPDVKSGSLKPDYAAQNIFRKDATIEYSCLPGFTAESGITRTCMGQRSWSDPSSSCSAITCPNIGVIAGGSYMPQKDKYEYQDTVTFTCNHGFKRSGVESAQCTINGVWTSNFPECRAITCTSPPNITDGSYVPQKHTYEYHNTVEYACNPGHILFGEKTVQCVNDGTWSRNPPKCKGVYHNYLLFV
ncbi:complement decay-accelerating factor-like [Spea bombifrons]|uniref:complement decay-accelerating factor-like n=1 Tax=Spea bombifrons TaxID=233779 RepID=UPI00234B4CEC|nr:complement decay-accelerating factor-like [Spea bombifrons]